jgi:hypothetical protein
VISDDLKRSVDRLGMVVTRLIDACEKGDVPGHEFHGNQWGGGGGGSEDSDGESEVKAPEPPPTRSRKESLNEAKKQGFKPTSRDSWINEQQGIEYLEAREGARAVEEAKKQGFKPTSKDDYINEMQAREHLSSGNKTPKMAENVIMATVVDEGKREKFGPPESLKAAGKIEPKVAWSNFGAASKQFTDWYKQNWGSTPTWEDKAAGAIKKFFAPEKLAGRLLSKILGESDW